MPSRSTTRSRRDRPVLPAWLRELRPTDGARSTPPATCAACDVDHAVTQAQAKCLDGPEALSPLGIARHGIETGGYVVVLGLLAVCLDQVLSRTVDLAHGVLLDPGSVAGEPRATLRLG